MSSTTLVLAPALGCFAAISHLLLTWLRAVVSLKGGLVRAMIALPFSLAVPVACLSAVMWFSPSSGGLALLSYWLTRSLIVSWVVRS